MWGCEAVAVRLDGRANPGQLVLNEQTRADLAALRLQLVQAHQQRFGTADDLLVGLQLTHSGRFARPFEKARMQPRTAYRHPLLDRRFGADSDQCLLSDNDLQQLTDDFVNASRLAWQAGFTWVDIKHCHGYLGHELLSGYDRPGRYGGSFENRTRFLREIVAGIRAEVPGLGIGVRLSIFDYVPYQPGPDGTGVPAAAGTYAQAFGGDGSGQGIDLQEPIRFGWLLRELGIDLLCSTCGSPYY
ncbi:MAG: NADH:flavin oxidoreductase, partial [Planctomycetaceae bacterium]